MRLTLIRPFPLQTGPYRPQRASPRAAITHFACRRSREATAISRSDGFGYRRNTQRQFHCLCLGTDVHILACRLFIRLARNQRHSYREHGDDLPEARVIRTANGERKPGESIRNAAERPFRGPMSPVRTRRRAAELGSVVQRQAGLLAPAEANWRQSQSGRGRLAQWPTGSAPLTQTPF